MREISHREKREQCTQTTLAPALAVEQIRLVLSQLPLYSVAAPRFRFRALAALAGRAPLGGAREVAIATYLVARLVDDALPSRALPQPTRAARASAAKSWLSALVTPGDIRPALVRLTDATAGEAAMIVATLKNVIGITAEYLDAAAVLELEKLAQALVE